MLVKLLPKDVEKGWDTLSQALIDSVPDYVNLDETGLANVLYALLDESLICWLITDDDFKEKGTVGIMTTMMTVDPPSGTKNLLIYTLLAYRKLTVEIIQDAYETLKNYAKGNECFKIVAYTDVPQIEKIVTSLGGKIGHTLVELEI